MRHCEGFVERLRSTATLCEAVEDGLRTVLRPRSEKTFLAERRQKAVGNGWDAAEERHSVLQYYRARYCVSRGRGVTGGDTEVTNFPRAAEHYSLGAVAGDEDDSVHRTRNTTRQIPRRTPPPPIPNIHTEWGGEEGCC